MHSNDAQPKQFSLFHNEDSAVGEEVAKNPPAGRYSNYIVYVNESGDHGMQTLGAKYPTFVLAFCVFHKRHYSEKVAPALQKFKFNHFGHDLVVLHENEIRKEKGAFNFFQGRDHKHAFLNELTDIIHASNFILISCVIYKEQLRGKPSTPLNPYDIALGFRLETLFEFLKEKHQHTRITHVVVECRGKKEDDDLGKRGTNRIPPV